VSTPLRLFFIPEAIKTISILYRLTILGFTTIQEGLVWTVTRAITSRLPLLDIPRALDKGKLIADEIVVEISLMG
tara:strand:- start:1225 stop:1449 length:225 start_codon:yes stop_codon:yes gene_type:complete